MVVTDYARTYFLEIPEISDITAPLAGVVVSAAFILLHFELYTVDFMQDLDSAVLSISSHLGKKALMLKLCDKLVLGKTFLGSLQV